MIDLLEGPVQALGYELVDVEAHAGRNGLLRVYIDCDDGITLDDCELVSHQIGAVLDVEDPMPGRYSLEVSSPGLDRPLRTREHFQLHQDRLVKIRLDVALDGRRNFTGRLVSVDDEDVVVDVDGQTHRLPLDTIAAAHLVPPH